MIVGAKSILKKLLRSKNGRVLLIFLAIFSIFSSTAGLAMFPALVVPIITSVLDEKNNDEGNINYDKLGEKGFGDPVPTVPPWLPYGNGTLGVYFMSKEYRDEGALGNYNHSGIDIANAWQNNDPVYAPIDCKVEGVNISNGGYFDSGNEVIISFKETWSGGDGETLYGMSFNHLSKTNPDLKVGDEIKQGTYLGNVGKSGLGAAGGEHLHITTANFSLGYNGQSGGNHFSLNPPMYQIVDPIQFFVGLPWSCNFPYYSGTLSNFYPQLNHTTMCDIKEKQGKE